MFSIDYIFSEPNRSLTLQEQKNMGAAGLDVWHFDGSLFLKYNGEVIHLEKHGITLVHALYNLSVIIDNLASNIKTKDTYRFNDESDDELIFRKKGDNIMISTNFDKAILQTSFAEFQEGVQIFGEELMYDLFKKYPGLMENKLIQDNFSDFFR